jgi:hypothetical protein
MQISNQNPGSSTDPTTTSITRADNASPNPAPHLSTASAAEVSAQDYSMVPSFELLSLNAVLAQVPPVRQDVLNETVRRLESGQLTSLSALDQTADAILGR